MASVRKRKRKDGSMFYEIQVSRGRGLSPYTMRWDRPEGLAEKTIQSQLRTVAVNFENDCKAGKVRTRREEKEAAELERKEREKAEQDKVTFRRFCNESFLPQSERVPAKRLHIITNSRLKNIFFQRSVRWK